MILAQIFPGSNRVETVEIEPRHTEKLYAVVNEIIEQQNKEREFFARETAKIEKKLVEYLSHG